MSSDLNYRARLWPQEKAREVMTPLMEYTDILITTEEDTKRVFGIEAESYEEVARARAGKFSFDAVAITLRATPYVWKNKWSAIAYADEEIHHGPEFEIEVVDRVGAGDSFAGGFFLRLPKGWSCRRSALWGRNLRAQAD